MKLLAILFTALLTSSCITLTEPDIYMCSIVNNDLAMCVPSNMSKPEYDIPVNDMLGFICVSPNDFGFIKKHHSELHKRLKDKESK